ncbi:MAG TPA: sterol desaturase family protein [Methylovirgula sp.]|nr:sterol desaturase family protein [Methylovirgula sp.]
MASLEDQDAGGSRTPSPEFLCASPRLFENPLLDKLSRVHWSMPLVFYMPFVALLAWLSFTTLRPVTVGCMALLGYMIWTLIEYFGHRYLFHAEFPGTLGARIHLLIHGVHHDHPNDPLRLVMPPLLSAPIMLAALLVGRVLFGFPLAYPALMGFMLGYLVYDMVHYYVHHAEPQTRLGRSLRRLHMLHHFRDPERGFGVSAPWWDKVFGTEHLPARQDGRR